MKKERLVLALDVALVLAMLQMLLGLNNPWMTTLAGFWEIRSQIFRTGASVLWLAVIWVCSYRSWDEAERVSPMGVLLGAAQAVLVLALPYFNQLIVNHKIARMYQQLYGALMLAMTAVLWLFQLALEKANGDAPACVEASGRFRRALAAAFCIHGLGIAASGTVLRQATWYAAVAAGLCVFTMGFALPEWRRRQITARSPG